MRGQILLVVMLAAAGCSSGDTVTTRDPISTGARSTTESSTSTLPPVSTTTSASVTTTTKTDTPGTYQYDDVRFTVQLPTQWQPNRDFSLDGASFFESHSALGIPSSDFTITFEEVEVDFDVTAHLAALKLDLSDVALNFQLLAEGTDVVHGEPSFWYEYVETFGGFDVVHREEVTVFGETLTTFSLVSPVEFFEADALWAASAMASFVLA